MTRWIRFLATAAVATILTVALPLSSAHGQAPPGQPGAEGEDQGESGRPLDGYIATAALCGAVLFIVGKSARR